MNKRWPVARIEQFTHRWFLLILVIGLCLRTIPLVEKQLFKGDELRAYLAATGHEGEFRTLLSAPQYPVDAWVKVSVWQRFVYPEAGVGLWAIAQDLAYWDIHPPLYFWLLHLWSQLWGVNFWSGALLNLGLEVAILWVSMRLAYSYWPQRQFAQVAGALWWLDPTAIRVSPLVRSYVLLTLLGLLFVYALYIVFYATPPNRRRGWHDRAGWRYAALVVTMVLGLLTHYLFLFLIGAAISALALHYGRQQWRRLVQLLALLLLAVVAFVVIYPDFFWAFTFLLEPRPEFWSHMGERLTRTTIVNGALYLPLVLGLALVAGVRWWPRREPTALSTGKANVRAIATLVKKETFFQCLLICAVIPVAATDLCFILLISPHHAMGPHYVNFATPIIALLTVTTVWGAQQRRWIIPLLFTLLIGGNLLQLHPAIRNFGTGPRLATTDLATTGVIIFDNPSSIHWLNLALHLPPDQEVLVASQATLFANPQAWLPRLQKAGGLYITLMTPQSEATGATASGRAALVHLIESRQPIALDKQLTPFGQNDLQIYRIAPLP